MEGLPLADYQQGYAYCSPFLDVQSLDQHLAWAESPVLDIVDPEPDPETALLRSQDLAVIDRWIARLPPGRQRLAIALMRGETQAEVARDEGVTEAAISKRMKALVAQGLRDLGDLRHSVLLN
jgi:DNA-directed RNA polymerase specialized sigma24 family protein